MTRSSPGTTVDWRPFDDGEAPWSEDEQFAQQWRACKSRRKQYGEGHCLDKDGSCGECDYDSQVVLRKKYLP